MPSMNKIFVMGYLGKDPTLRHTQSNKAVSNFSVGATEKYGETEHTEWFEVVAWDKQAENCAKFLKKGKPCLVEGRIQTRKWEDAEGSTRYKQELVAQRVTFLGSPEGKGESAKDQVSDDDVPF